MNGIRLLEPVLLLAARRGLAGRFDRATVRALLDEALAAYEAQRAGLPREASAGGRLMVHLAALTIGLYRALLGRGVPEDEARRLTADVTGWAYAKMASVPTTLSRLGSNSARDRLQRATDLFRRFPFSAPSYDMVDVDGGDDVVAFDVRRCPVAEHFRAQGLGDLCIESWCNLDVHQELRRHRPGRLRGLLSDGPGRARCLLARQRGGRAQPLHGGRHAELWRSPRDNSMRAARTRRACQLPALAWGPSSRSRAEPKNTIVSCTCSR